MFKMFKVLNFFIFISAVVYDLRVSQNTFVNVTFIQIHSRSGPTVDRSKTYDFFLSDWNHNHRTNFYKLWIILQIMIHKQFLWRIYDDDSFEIFPPSYWRQNHFVGDVFITLLTFNTKSFVTKISSLSSTSLVINIPFQHPFPTSLSNIPRQHR